MYAMTVVACKMAGRARAVMLVLKLAGLERTSDAL